jgi:hypothetical protein
MPLAESRTGSVLRVCGMTTLSEANLGHFSPGLECCIFKCMQHAGPPKMFYDILVEIDNNVMELNLAKQNMGSGQTIRWKTIIDMGSVANSGKSSPNYLMGRKISGSRYLFTEINY